MKCLNILKLSSMLLMLGLIAPVYAADKASAKNVGHDAVSASCLSTIIALDSDELLAAIQASNKQASSDVEDFAKMMIQDHGDNFTKALALANKVQALPLNPNPDNLRDKGFKEVVSLAALDGDAYNKAYADAMAKGHQGALDAIDKLLKKVKNSDVKDFLTATRATVAHHLDDAKKLQASMKS